MNREARPRRFAVRAGPGNSHRSHDILSILSITSIQCARSVRNDRALTGRNDRAPDVLSPLDPSYKEEMEGYRSAATAARPVGRRRGSGARKRHRREGDRGAEATSYRAARATSPATVRFPTAAPGRLSAPLWGRPAPARRIGRRADDRGGDGRRGRGPRAAGPLAGIIRRPRRSIADDLARRLGIPGTQKAEGAGARP
jgi:hypothetical protein